MSNADLLPTGTRTISQSSFTALTTMPSTLDDFDDFDGPQQPDSLFLLAFTSRLPLQTYSQSHSARSSLSSMESTELEDRRYSLFGPDADEAPEQTGQSLLPVWPEELQYAEETSCASPRRPVLPELRLSVAPVDAKFGEAEETAPQSPTRAKMWITKAAKKIFLARKVV